MGDRVRSLTEVKINSMQCLPVIHKVNHLIVKGYQVPQA